MATARQLIADWATDGGERSVLYSQVPDAVLRWLNEAQVRFSEVSGILKGTWNPTTDGDGKVELPGDWLREVPDRVQYLDRFLQKANFADYRAPLSSGGTYFYAVWGGSLNIFDPISTELIVPYIRKPGEIRFGGIGSADLEIPSEYHHDLLLFMDAQFSRRSGDMKSYLFLLNEFKARSMDAGIMFARRNDNVPITRSG